MFDQPIITVDSLRKVYRATVALDGISLSVARGEALGIVGPNGAGKTTLMGCLLGLLDPTEGSVLIDGRSPNDRSTKRKIGYVPERLSFSRWMTGYDFVALHASLCANPLPVAEVLEQVGLAEEAWRRRLDKYSRGMLQRVALAQALVGRPEILFLDEPTSGIDPAGAIRFRTILRELAGAGATVILNSHQLDQMDRICSRVVFLQKGRIVSSEFVREESRLEDRFLALVAGEGDR